MKQAVMYGSGNIGRSFIGALFSQSGYQVTFVDVAEPIVEASIGRMVPIQTEEMKDGDPLRVCVEQYDFLLVDQAAFQGEIPQIQSMIPFSPFDFYLKRKLYIHNMGRAVCAYLGDYLKLSYIYQAIDTADIHIIVQNAMEESVLAGKYKVRLRELQNVI